MNDIVTRLRESAAAWANEVDTRLEAADEIARLRKELDGLKVYHPVSDQTLRKSLQPLIPYAYLDAGVAIVKELFRIGADIQCWNKDDPDHYALSPKDMANAFADGMYDDNSHTFDVLVSIPFPDRKMRVTLTGGEDRNMEWEWAE